MRFRWAIIGLTLFYSAYTLLAPGEDNKWSLDNYKENIHLGLDLRGGVFMKLEVDLADALDQYLEEQAGTIKGSLEGDKFTVASAVHDFDSQSVTLHSVASTEYPDTLKRIKEIYGNWTVTRTGDNITLRLHETAKKAIEEGAITQTVKKIQQRVDELGVTEPVINRTLGSNRIIVELAGADDDQRVRQIVQEPGQLEWRLAVRGASQAATPEELQRNAGNVPPGAKMVHFVDEARGSDYYMYLQEVMLTASHVSDVSVTRDERGLPAVSIVLNRAGGQIMHTNSGSNVGNQLAIVLDGIGISAPVINSQLSERFIIQGSFSQQEVEDLVIKIKSGSLPAKVVVLQSRKIGPTLGRDAIKSGTMSAVWGLALVVVFIVVYYRVAGLFALASLALNLPLIMAMLSGIGAVLTLPGVAGFILTIGMAVDANVLIFERIREELRSGTMPKNAVDVGYKSAFVTIMDANITTFLAAFCLYLMGEGPIKGFAIMLMIGIVCSIFTAVFCSRTFFLQYIKRRSSAKTLSIWPLWASKSPGSD